MAQQPMKIKYTIELNEATKSYRIVLSLPAAPIWRVLEEQVPSKKMLEMLTQSLNLFPDPEMIKEMYSQIIETEKKGYSPSR